MTQDRYRELEERRQQASLGGGEARIQAQHAKGKRTARERLALWLDEGTFQETGPYIAHRQPDREPVPGDAVVTGYGLIDGRRVCVYAQDFTVFGGSFSEAQDMKVSQVMQQMAMLTHCERLACRKGLTSMSGERCVASSRG